MGKKCDLEAREAQEEAGAHADLIDKVSVARFNALADIAHDMHAQNLHSASLDIAGLLCKVGQVFHTLYVAAALLLASLRTSQQGSSQFKKQVTA